MGVKILLLGELESSLIEETARHLRDVLGGVGVEVMRGDPSAMLRKAYTPTRNQYVSSTLLKEAETLIDPVAGEKILLVVNVDLYASGLNYIFGEAYCPGSLAVISTYRLRPEFYDSQDPPLYASRVRKEATHELGHTAGLQHCKNPSCVMLFSNHILDTDRKSDRFCPACSARIVLKSPRPP